MSSPSRRPQPRPRTAGEPAAGPADAPSAERAPDARSSALGRAWIAATNGVALGGRVVTGARDRADAKAAARRSGTEPPIEASGWGSAIAIMSVLGAAIWTVQIVNAADDYRLNRFGLAPRAVAGLWGVLTMPFLHDSYDHMLSDTAPLVLIGWVVMLAGFRIWAVVSLLVLVVGGGLAWLVTPGSGGFVGTSALIFGWIGYLVARAYFSRKIKWIVMTAMVLIFFGTLLYGLVPVQHSHVPWEANVCGFAAGIAAGAVLHPRGGRPRRFRRTAVS